MAQLQSVRSFERFVLLTVVELADDGETPAHSYEVTELAKARMDDLDRPPFGGIERQEVITALSSLAGAELLGKDEVTSATGKGRPAYVLGVDADAVVTELRGDDDVGPYAEVLSDD